MKRSLRIFIVLLITSVLTGCGGAEADSGRAKAAAVSGNSVSDVLEQRINQSGGTYGSEDEAEAFMKNGGVTGGTQEDISSGEAMSVFQKSVDGETEGFTASGIDIDLTELGDTVGYSWFYNMLSEPEGYIGKTVRMNGSFAVYHDEEKDEYYFACFISDSMGCCSQVIEFVLAGEKKYPDDYPEPESNITVTGIFDTYEEKGYKYCRLIDAELAE